MRPASQARDSGSELLAVEEPECGAITRVAKKLCGHSP